MQDVTITELDSNLSFDAKIDNPPEITHNFSRVYIDEKEVKRLNVSQSTGLIDVKLSNPNDVTADFVKKWYDKRKRIDLMIETDNHIYLMKGCSVKKFDTPKKVFTFFYNTFKEA